MILQKNSDTAPHMPFSTPFRDLFLPFASAVQRFSSALTQVRTGQRLRFHDAVHRPNVFHHGFGDGCQVVGLQLYDQVVVPEQHRSVGNVRERSHPLVDTLFGPGLNVDEDVSDGHGGDWGS